MGNCRGFLPEESPPCRPTLHAPFATPSSFTSTAWTSAIHKKSSPSGGLMGCFICPLKGLHFSAVCTLWEGAKMSKVLVLVCMATSIFVLALWSALWYIFCLCCSCKDQFTFDLICMHSRVWIRLQGCGAMGRVSIFSWVEGPNIQCMLDFYSPSLCQ